MAVIVAISIAVPLLGWSAIALVSNDDDPATPSAATASQDSSDDAAAEGRTGRDEQPDRNEGAADDEPQASTSTDAGSTDDDAARRQAEEAIAACATQLTAGQAVVTEAGTGVGHWNDHIEARTDLLEGRNTKEETSAIWKSTRLAGPDDLDRFEAVLSTYEQLSGCEELSDTDAPGDLGDDAEACLSRATTVASAIDAAIVAIADWEEHLGNMARHADGKMDADEAQDKWVEAWESGPTNINAFNDARADLDEAPRCPRADE